MASEHWQKQGGTDYFSGYKAQVKGKRFYIGGTFGIDKPTAANKRRAEQAADIYAATLTAAGVKQWTPELEAAAKLAVLRKFNLAPAHAAPAVDALGSVEAATPAVPSPVARSLRTANHVEAGGHPVAVAPIVGGLMLHAAVDAYIKREYSRAASGQIVEGTVDKTKFSLNRFKKFAEDRPLAAWAYADCRSTVDHFASRPAKPNGERLSDQTAADTIIAVKAFFADAKRQKAWIMDSDDQEAAFAFKRGNMLTEAELDEKGKVKTFKLEELRTLYRFCNNERARLYFLLALNCGFTQKEIATLRLSHLHQGKTKSGASCLLIKRRRNKTKVWGKWRLWTETRALLTKHLAPDNAERNPHGLALLSDEGNPLLGKNVKGTSRYDLIRGFWLKQLDNAAAGVESGDLFAGKPFNAVRQLGFKYLRKTASQLIRNASDKDTSEAFLAHVDPTMGKEYNNANMKKLAKAMRKVRRQLEPMFATRAFTAGGDIDYTKRKPKNRKRKAKVAA